MSRTYPEVATGGFPEPPREITDEVGREISITAETDRADLIDMYGEFDPADRAQGIPPTGESAIEEWLEAITRGDSLEVTAYHDRDAVGHAVLVDDAEESYELAIFVLGDYQGAGIGTEVLRTLLGMAEARDIERIWLSVERWNDPARRLYRKIGFQTTEDGRFDQVMTLRIG